MTEVLVPPLCPYSRKNGLHRVAVMNRLAFSHNAYLQGYCEWCTQWCKALPTLGARWYTASQFEVFYSFVIPELP